MTDTMMILAILGVMSILFLIGRVCLRDGKKDSYDFVAATPEELLRLGYGYIGNFKKETGHPNDVSVEEVKKQLENKGWKDLVASVAVENDFNEGYGPSECYSLWGKRKLQLIVSNKKRARASK